MNTQRLELTEILHRGLSQLGYSRAVVQHEKQMIDTLERAVNEPDYLEALRTDTYSSLQHTSLADFEKDAILFIIT